MKKEKLSFSLAAALAFMFCAVQSSGQDITMKAYELRMNGNPGGAMALLDSALNIYPDSARLWFEKGRCVDWTKMEGCTKFVHTWKYVSPRLRASKKCFNKAIRLDPDNARYHYWAAENGALRSLLGIYSPWKWPAVPFIMGKSVNHAESAVYLSPENAHYRYTLVSFSRFGGILGGNKKSARAHADTLDTIDPVYGTMAYEELETKKKPYDSPARFLELENQYPDHPVLMQKLAQLYSNKGPEHFNSARYYYRKSLALNPQNIEAINGFYRSMIRHGQGDVPAEMEAYLQNVDSSYNYYKSVGHQLLGQYYQTKGEPEKAKERWAEARRLNPNNNSTNIKDLDPPGK